MTTIPSRLAQTTRISRTLEEARQRSTALYRNFYRSAPEICALYALDVPPSTLRAKFRTQFEKNKTIKDLAVLDLMLLKAQQEYQETMNGWKQVPHIMKWFAEEEAPARPEGFLEKFYVSRDEGRGPVVMARVSWLNERIGWVDRFNIVALSPPVASASKTTSTKVITLMLDTL
uniref:Uncharacterized protein n=1 Tax=Ustilago esculenta TaxID=185366 RepID=A0A481SGV4_9BASI|nr:hypothetical protein UE_1405 [Ustilago esculenta]